MQWYKNLKIGVKLILAFIAVAMLAGVVGIVGVVNILALDKSDTELYENMTIPISQVSDMSTSFQRIRVNLRSAIMLLTRRIKKNI